MEPVYRIISNTATRLLYRVQYDGFEKLPKHGPFILVVNHVSYTDGMILQAGCPRPIRFLIDLPIYELPIINYIMRHNRGIPILPKKKYVEKALDLISQGLEHGDVICIFPEGQLTNTGNLGRFKPGIEWIIDRDPVPIYPVALVGLWEGFFSRKYRHLKLRGFPKGIRSRVVACCGDVIHPADADVDKLQSAVLALKEKIRRDYGLED